MNTATKPGASGLWTVSVPLFAWAALIIAVSSTPGQHLPALGFRQSDKLAHGLEFAVLGVLLYRYLVVRTGLDRGRAWVTGLGLGIGFAAFDELHQIVVPMRFCTWADVLADAAGLIVGLWGAFVFHRRKTAR